MATLTLTLVTTTGTVTKSYELSDGAPARVITWFKALNRPQLEGATNTVVINRWFDFIVANAKGAVQRYEIVETQQAVTAPSMDV